MRGLNRFCSLVVLRQVFAVACALFAAVQMALADIGNPEPADVGTKGTAFGKKVKGNLGERMMDDFYTSSGYTKVDCSVGVNGADGLYVTYNKDGTVDNVIFSECKTDTAQLGRIDSGKGPYQGSKEYYLRKIDEKIAALERGPQTPENAKQLKQLKQIRRKVQAGDFRSRLFKMSHETRNGKTYLKMQTYDLDFKKGPNTPPTATAKGRPALIDMTSPDAELTPYYRNRRNKFFENLADELVDRTNKGGYGIKKPLTRQRARAIAAEIKKAYQTGGITSPNDLIVWVARECGIGVEEAAEIVEKSLGKGTTSGSKANNIKLSKKSRLNVDLQQKDFVKCNYREAKIGGRIVKVVDVPVVTRGGVMESAEIVARRSPLEAAAVRAAFAAPRKTLIKSGAKNFVKAGTKATLKEGVSHAAKDSDEFLKSPAGEGLIAGIVTFVIDEGIAIVEYSEGDLAKDQFVQKTVFNTAKSGVMGGAMMGVASATLSAGLPFWAALGANFAVCIVIEKGSEYIWAEVEKEYGVLPGVTDDELLYTLPPCVRNRHVWVEDLDEKKMEKRRIDNRKIFDDGAPTDFEQTGQSFY